MLFALFCGDHFGWTSAQTSYAFAYVGLLAVIVQGGLLRQLLKRDIEKELAVVGATLLAVSLWLMPRAASVGGFLAVSALMAVGNGLVTPVLSGMASRHVHGRAQGRVLGMMAGAGSLGRFLGPWLAVKPLPADFSLLVRPLQGALFTTVNAGYLTAFTWSARICGGGRGARRPSAGAARTDRRDIRFRPHPRSLTGVRWTIGTRFPFIRTHLWPYPSKINSTTSSARRCAVSN